MKTKILLLFIIAASFTSCSTSYRTAQTPDDVYYSPVKLQNDNVRRNDEDKVSISDVYVSSEDREIRRRIHNRRLRMYDDWYYCGYDTYRYPVYVPKSNTTSTNQPRKFNLGVYNPGVKTDQNGKPVLNTSTGNVPIRNFNTTNSTNNGTGVGNFLRKVFDGNGNSSNSNNSNSNTPVRTDRSNNNSNNNSSGNPGSSGTNTNTNTNNAPVRSFGKGN